MGPGIGRGCFSWDSGYTGPDLYEERGGARVEWESRVNLGRGSRVKVRTRMLTWMSRTKKDIAGDE